MVSLHLSNAQSNLGESTTDRSMDKFEIPASSIRCFKIPLGSTGCGYDQVFANCLNTNLTSVRVEEPYIRESYQVRNFVAFCELLAQTCDDLPHICLTTSLQSWERRVKSDLATDQAVARVKGIFGSRLDAEYKEGLHDREFNFNNDWTVIIGRGLDYFFKGPDDMSLRACKETTVVIIQHKKVAKADEPEEINNLKKQLRDANRSARLADSQKLQIETLIQIPATAEQSRPDVPAQQHISAQTSDDPKPKLNLPSGSTILQENENNFRVVAADPSPHHPQQQQQQSGPPLQHQPHAGQSQPLHPHHIGPLPRQQQHQQNRHHVAPYHVQQQPQHAYPIPRPSHAMAMLNAYWPQQHRQPQQGTHHVGAPVSPVQNAAGGYPPQGAAPPPYGFGQLGVMPGQLGALLPAYLAPQYPAVPAGPAAGDDGQPLFPNPPPNFGQPPPVAPQQPSAQQPPVHEKKILAFTNPTTNEAVVLKQTDSSEAGPSTLGSAAPVPPSSSGSSMDNEQQPQQQQQQQPTQPAEPAVCPDDPGLDKIKKPPLNN